MTPPILLIQPAMLRLIALCNLMMTDQLYMVLTMLGEMQMVNYELTTKALNEEKLMLVVSNG